MSAGWWITLWMAGTDPTAAATTVAARDVLVVTSVAPVDSERLADAMRAYLGDYGIDVRTAPAAAPGDLRRELAETSRAGADVRAVAAIRVVGGAAAGTVEIQVVDRVTQKVLVASIPRPARDEDLYRAVALKVRALLRSTLAESPDLLEQRPELARMAAGDGRAPGAGDASGADFARRPLSLAVGYVVASFPRAGMVQQGIAVSGAYRLAAPRVGAARIELGLEVAALRSWRGDSGDVAVVADALPIGISAGLRWASQRAQVLAGVMSQLVLFSVNASGPGPARTGSRTLVPGAGGVGEARWRLGSDTWVYARASAVGVMFGDRYTVRGATVLDTSRVQIQGSAGFSAAIW